MEQVLVAPEEGKENGKMNGVVKLSVTDTEIAKLKGDYMGLTINGVADKAGFKKVYEARQEVKRIRVAATKYADELKEQAIAWQKKVNTEKNRVIGELEAIETHLQAEEDKVTAEKERLKKEAERLEQERVQKMVNELTAFNHPVDLVFLKSLDDKAYGDLLASAKLNWDVEQLAQAERDRLKKIEEEKLRADREELATLRKQQEDQQKLIAQQQEDLKKQQQAIDDQKKLAEQKRLDDIKALEDAQFKVRAGQLLGLGLTYSVRDDGYGIKDIMVGQLHMVTMAPEQWDALISEITPKIELAKAEIESDRIKKENDRLEREKQAAETERLRLEALRPDKDKLTGFADRLDSLVDFDVTAPEAIEILGQINVRIAAMKRYILEKTASL